VFAHFTSAVEGARVAVVGRYPGLELLWQNVSYQCLEKRELPGTLPASEQANVLGSADWVFFTASSIVNHTLPDLFRCTRAGAKRVLLGPSLPWLFEWGEFGVNYLAGVEIEDRGALRNIVHEAGGTRIFDQAVRYRLLELG
jgi:uncharacterized protein